MKTICVLSSRKDELTAIENLSKRAGCCFEFLSVIQEWQLDSYDLRFGFKTSAAPNLVRQ